MFTYCFCSILCSPSGNPIFMFDFLTIFHLSLRLSSVLSLHALVWLFSIDLSMNSLVLYSTVNTALFKPFSGILLSDNVFSVLECPFYSFIVLVPFLKFLYFHLCFVFIFCYMFFNFSIVLILKSWSGNSNIWIIYRNFLSWLLVIFSCFFSYLVIYFFFKCWTAYTKKKKEVPDDLSSIRYRVSLHSVRYIGWGPNHLKPIRDWALLELGCSFSKTWSSTHLSQFLRQVLS